MFGQVCSSIKNPVVAVITRAAVSQDCTPKALSTLSQKSATVAENDDSVDRA